MNIQTYNDNIGKFYGRKMNTIHNSNFQKGSVGKKPNNKWARVLLEKINFIEENLNNRVESYGYEWEDLIL